MGPVIVAVAGIGLELAGLVLILREAGGGKELRRAVNDSMRIFVSYRTTGAGSATLPAFQASGSGRIHPSPTLEQHLAALESRVNGLVNDLRAAEERQQQAVNSLRDGLAVEKQTADRRTRTATALIGAGAVLQMVAVVGAAAG